MIVFTWDEVICEVSEWAQEDPPGGLSDEDTLLLADARITKEIGDPNSTFDHKIRKENGVLVLDAKFGQFKVTRTYICQEDPEKARVLAQKELDELLAE